MTEAAANDMLSNPRQKQRCGMRMTKPVRREPFRHTTLEQPAKPPDLPGDSLRLQRGEPRLAREVHEHPPRVQVTHRRVRAQLAQPPQVVSP